MSIYDVSKQSTEWLLSALQNFPGGCEVEVFPKDSAVLVIREKCRTDDVITELLRRGWSESFLGKLKGSSAVCGGSWDQLIAADKTIPPDQEMRTLCDRDGILHDKDYSWSGPSKR